MVEGEREEKEEKKRKSKKRTKKEYLNKMEKKIEFWDVECIVRAPTLDVLNVPNAKYLAYLAHQTPENTKYQMFQIS